MLKIESLLGHRVQLIISPVARAPLHVRCVKFFCLFVGFYKAKTIQKSLNFVLVTWQNFIKLTADFIEYSFFSGKCIYKHILSKHGFGLVRVSNCHVTAQFAC